MLSATVFPILVYTPKKSESGEELDKGDPGTLHKISKMPVLQILFFFTICQNRQMDSLIEYLSLSGTPDTLARIHLFYYPRIGALKVLQEVP